MKKFTVIMIALAFVAAIPASHLLTAAKKDKVAVCHFVKKAPSNPNFIYGKVLMVPESAVSSHLAHGDKAMPFATYIPMNQIPVELRHLWTGNTPCAWFAN